MIENNNVMTEQTLNDYHTHAGARARAHTHTPFNGQFITTQPIYITRLILDINNIIVILDIEMLYLVPFTSLHIYMITVQLST